MYRRLDERRSFGTWKEMKRASFFDAAKILSVENAMI
jgi:hypothetical protein